MTSILRMAAAAIAALACAGAATAAEAKCEVDGPVVFGALDWDSAAFHTALAQFVLAKGYGCKVDQIPGSTIPLINGLARGDVQVLMEIWSNNQPEAWTKAAAAGQVREHGTNFPDATQGWFVPRYVVEGDAAPAKGLRSVRDLAQHKAVFRDPEEPSKGRFYNCVAGWQCEVVNEKKLHAYGLTPHFTNFRPGTGAALAAAAESAVKRRQPILFYYWGPTWLLGKIGGDLVMLEEPAFDQAAWDAMTAEKDPTRVTRAVAYPVVKVVVGINSAFADKAPGIARFLDAYETTGALVSEALAFMQDSGGKAEDAARHFLKTHPEVWQRWVPADVAARVKAAL
ncbi:ABC transporter substrate-binding protein [Stella sp.]|uniref:ABC transporter substrate-binding protein n=1 Tax=Stella sp. TaxID=2912054 RepID=UPI0035B249E7